MHSPIVHLSRFAIAAWLLTTVGCSSGESSDQSTAPDPSTSTVTVDLYSWWVAPGEAQALQGLMNAFTKAHPTQKVRNSGFSTGTASRANLDTAFAAGNFPDVFQLNSQDLGPFDAQHPGQVAALDSVLSSSATVDAFLPDILDAVTLDGIVQLVPLAIPRESAFFYNTTLFSANGLEPPTSVDELLSTCATLKKAGIVPIALATGPNNGWIVRETFNGILQGTMGAALFKDFATATKPVTDPEIAEPLKAAIATLATIITQYINSNSASTLANGNTFGWTDAADEVKAGKAAMYIHGDWVKGYWTALGWTPGIDFGQTGAPGASDVFFYGVDGLGMPTSAPHPAAAENFMNVAASAAGQVAFARSKGSSPARIDVGDRLDVLGKATLDDLVNAKVRLRVVGLEAWDTALGEFSSSDCSDADQEALYQVYVDNPPPSR
jgi:glucose/mannose transport system substrate-binding protein